MKLQPAFSLDPVAHNHTLKELRQTLFIDPNLMSRVAKNGKGGLLDHRVVSTTLFWSLAIYIYEVNRFFIDSPTCEGFCHSERSRVR